MMVSLFDEKLGFQLLDAQPYPVVFCLPVSGSLGQEHTVVDFQLVYGNKAAATLAGVSEKELPYQLLMTCSWLSQHDKTSIFSLLSQVFKKGESVEKTDFFQSLDKYLHLSFSKVGDGVLMMARDVSEEISVQIEKERDIKFENSILDTSINGVLVLEAIRNETNEIVDFYVVKLNQAFADIVGKPKLAIIGQRFFSFFPYKDTGLFERSCQVVETGSNMQQEIYYQLEGLEYWYDVSLTPLGDDGLVQTFCRVTAIKKEKQSLLAAVQDMQDILNFSQTAICLYSPVHNEAGEIIDFRHKVVNNAAAANFGEKPEVVVGTMVGDWVPEYRYQEPFKFGKLAMETGQEYRFVKRHQINEIDAWIDVLTRRVGDHLLTTAHDFTPIKHLQQQLETSIQELRRSNESLEQFAHATSHDLQEPLRKISIFIEKLEERCADSLDDESYSYIERIKTVAKRMRRLIQDLLVFAEVGAQHNSLEEVDLTAVVREVIADLEVAIQERDATVEVGELGKVMGDSIHLQQLFQNLISNSLKYSRLQVPPRIIISSILISGNQVPFALTDKECMQSYHLIELRDNGQGFTTEQAGQIFKVFQRLPQHRLDQKGSGIGLAIVKRVVENHRGYISAEGIPDKGATFRIYLPQQRV